jgi:glycerophosphoryl diester phosphodiesterase
MEIIAHRGFWKEENEKNTMAAFKRSAEFGVGTETDFRDYMEKLAVSHNVADASCPMAEDFFALYRGTDKTLALNVKADGIQQLLKELLNKYDIQNYFCFDMSIPDTLGYIDSGLKFYVRESEYEVINSLYERADGVWVDGFEGDDWINPELILAHRRKGKKVCIVSSDLHARDYTALWERLKTAEILNDDGVILCTDHPDNAKEFFYG